MAMAPGVPSMSSITPNGVPDGIAMRTQRSSAFDPAPTLIAKTQTDRIPGERFPTRAVNPFVPDPPDPSAATDAMPTPSTYTWTRIGEVVFGSAARPETSMARKPPTALVTSPAGESLPFVEPNQSVKIRQKLRLP
jgi:hypothetical protein